MPIIASQHTWKDKDHRPLSDWPDDCTVQWGGSGIVLSDRPGGSYGTAFFEAFPENGGFIRGEGPTIDEAEARAFSKFQKISACDHAWSRKNYTNGGAICRHCGGFMTVFRPIVKLGMFREPLSPTALDMIADGAYRPDPDDQSQNKYARKQWLKARQMGIDLPDFATAPQVPFGFQEDDYSRACRRAVIAFLKKNPDMLEMTPEGKGISGLFEGVHIRSLKMMLEDHDAENSDDPTP